MLRKKYLAILLFLIIGICAVSAVSASDLNATDGLIGEEAGDEMAVSNDNVLSKDPGTYSDLDKQIKKHANGEMTLSRDYIYVKDVDDDKGTYNSISIEDDIVIYGNGHLICANDANPFMIGDDINVKLYNVTFYGEYASGPVTKWGGAIWNWGNLFMEDCIFINCQASDHGGAITNSGNLDLVRCSFVNCQAKNEGGAIYNAWKARMNMCYFKDNSVSKSNGMGGAISNNGNLFINCSYFVDNTAKSKGGAIYTNDDAWIQYSVFGTYIDESETEDYDMAGTNKAKLGTSIYNEIGSVCTADLCLFNESQSNSDVEVISNVIATNSYFENHSIISGGVIKNCTTNQKLSTTVNSTGFTFKTASSIDTFYNSGEKLKVVVTSNPTGERVSNVAVELTIDGDTHKTVMTDSNGVASYKVSNLSPGNHNIAVKLYNTTFSQQQVTVPVTVKKAKLSIKASKFTTTYKSGKKWTIKVFDESNNKSAANVEVLIKVGNRKSYFSEKTDSNGIATFTDTDYSTALSKGNYKVVLSISQKGYYAEPVTTSIKVNAKKLNIIGETNKFKNCGQVIIGAYDAVKDKWVSGIKLQIKIFTGKKYKTFNLVTKKSKKLGGIGVLIETNAFSVGKHKLTVKITSPNYSGSEKGYIVIPKSAKNYKKFTYVITNGKGKYLST
jgi:predicted outer membrane repeat protein